MSISGKKSHLLWRIPQTNIKPWIFITLPTLLCLNQAQALSFIISSCSFSPFFSSPFLFSTFFLLQSCSTLTFLYIYVLHIFSSHSFSHLTVQTIFWVHENIIIGDRHALSENDIPHQRPTCLIGDRHACGDPWKTNMPAESNRNWNTFIFLNILIFIYFLLIYICTCWYPMGHVGFRLVSDEACRGLG